ncbi:MAG TPA: bifunctional nuclease family protein [bacterium]|nr:bifunctional nuclease family protein [bacterium]
MIEVKVRGIAIDQECKQPMVVLTDAEEKVCLPILIGVPEATSIFSQLNDQTPARPMTHDLIRGVMDLLGSRLVKVLINDLSQNTFYARLFLENPGTGDRLDLDARPSDAIALALRAGAPIFVAEKVVVAPGVVIRDKEKNKKELKAFKKSLENLSPADFDASGKHPQ